MQKLKPKKELSKKQLWRRNNPEKAKAQQDRRNAVRRDPVVNAKRVEYNRKWREANGK